uniref:E74 like ETS transcription factor 3 n=1 Tax=Strix occidentalis caurina TaxID=311401 RepID=A0A8D0EPB5_STROC
MAALLPSLCIFALTGGCAWSFLTARLFSHRSCAPFQGPSETAVWRASLASAPRFCQANSKIWLFHEGQAGTWSPPGCRVTGMCFSELPYFWTKVQVLEWISYHVEKNKYDASSIDFSCCNMDGHALCHCTRDQMRLIFGPLGDELYDRLHEISECPKVPFSSSIANPSPPTPAASDELNWIIDLLEKEDATSQETFLDSSHLGKREGPAKDPQHLPCYTACFPLPAPRGTHLWEFIRDILIHPELNEGLMKWEDRREGVFKFLRSEAVAQLWGQKKKNSSMTYEKLSRAMRYYYKREILERVDGRRLVYKFGKNSSGWKEEEVLNRNKEL